MNTSILLITLTSMFLIIYHHVIYPLTLKMLAKLRKQELTIYANDRAYSDNQSDKNLPVLTMVIPAFNEENVIADKIINLACLDYPRDKFKLIIACDGCTDKTYQIAKQTLEQSLCQGLKVDLINFENNRGKVAVINDVISKLDCELVALSDVSALLSIDALLATVERFKDEKLGVLTGHYRLLTPGTDGEAVYWRYQSQIKQNEANMGSTIGVHGAFYVFRRQLFSPLPLDTINDDFILPMSIVAKGYRADYDNNIKALELENASLAMDQNRRRRIAAGNVQQLIRLKALFHPKYGGVAFNFLSGKGLRCLMPYFLMMAFIGSIILSWHSILFLGLSIIQTMLYAVSTYIIAFSPSRTPKILHTIAYIVSGYFAISVGNARYILGLEKGPWHRV